MFILKGQSSARLEKWKKSLDNALVLKTLAMAFRALFFEQERQMRLFGMLPHRYEARKLAYNLFI